MTRNIVHLGDVREWLPTLPDNSVHMCVTSPPYWGLRDYGADGQLGLEKSPEEYVANMVAVFRQVRRVLRDDGTLWLNLGDSYAQDTKWGGATGGKHVKSLHGSTGIGRNRRHTGLPGKNLVGIPWRVAFALQADGWYLRQDIIWNKPNPMPESVTDRCTKSHEYLFLLAKSERYYYDSEAVKEASITGDTRTPYGSDGMWAMDGRNKWDEGKGKQRANADGTTRNRRSVWTIATRGYSGAHFATFPPAIVEPCILAGTSERGCCPTCGAGWERVMERTDTPDTSANGSRFDAGKTYARDGGERTQTGERFLSSTTGWRPGCDCGNTDPRPCIVMDPFMGSGTVAEVAYRHGRNYTGCEINPKYHKLIAKRLSAVSLPIFAEAAP